MWFALIWMTILAVDLLVWILFTRFYKLNLLSYRFSFFRRPIVVAIKAKSNHKDENNTNEDDKSRYDDDKSRYEDDKSEKEDLEKLDWAILDKNQGDFGGLTPPPNVRLAIAVVVLLQNSIAMGAVGGENAVQTICRRSGQLALVNMIPLILFAFPDLILGRIVSQCSPEIIWAHHLFGWLVWLDALVHAGLSTIVSTDSVAIVYTFLGTVALTFLYMALLCKVRPRQRYANHRRRVISGHGILGAASMATIALHSPNDIFPAIAVVSAVLFLVGILVRDPKATPVRLDKCDVLQGKQNAVSAKVATRGLRIISRQMNSVRITDGQGCYFEVNGKPIRVAWTLLPKQKATFANEISGAATEADSSSRFRLIADFGTDEHDTAGTLKVVGPYYPPKSRYAHAPESLIIFATDFSFSQAHAILHARMDSQRRLSTMVYWIDASDWLRELYEEDHICPHKDYIKFPGNVSETPSSRSNASLRSVARGTVQVAQPVEYHSQVVDIENLGESVIRNYTHNPESNTAIIQRYAELPRGQRDVWDKSDDEAERR